jgi:hypothetical protein
MEWWDKNWARLDPNYSPTPYAQLAAALTSLGDRDAANEIRYLGRVRECETDKGLGCPSVRRRFRHRHLHIPGSLLGHRHLPPRRGAPLEVPAAKQHGPIWCFGASLARLLPVIEISKEFTAFFDDPERKRLSGWQSFIFSAMGIVGFVLGAILIAAVSGLTQSS